MTEAEFKEMIKRLPGVTGDIITHAIKVTQFPSEAAIALMTAAEAITRHYDTPSFDELVAVIKKAAPPVV